MESQVNFVLNLVLCEFESTNRSRRLPVFGRTGHLRYRGGTETEKTPPPPPPQPFFF